MPTGKQIEEFTGRHTSVTIDFGGDIGLKGQDPRLRGRKFMRLSRAVAKESLLFLALVALIGLVATPCASGQTIGKPPSQAAKQALPRGKKTILGLYVTAKEAYEWWKAAPEKVKILDVRTPEEYIIIGHADRAWNIPLAFQTYEWDAGKQHFAMAPNPDFVSRAKALFTPDETLLVMCRSGGRSALAVNHLAEAGFRHVYNITDGMEGDKVEDPENLFHGKRMKNGWKNSGLPWTYHLNPERMRLPKRK